jgi:hypothetical protein
MRVERVNSHIEVIVSDTGIGIREDFLPYVFERFHQADAETTRKTGGLGLDLSIVRHIVDMHGGAVHVTSEGEGKGATFRVCLPLMIVHAEAVRETREHPRTEKLTPLTRLGDLSDVRVLAIDDEEDALSLLRVVLETAGAEVVTMSSAQEDCNGSPTFVLMRSSSIWHARSGRIRIHLTCACVARRVCT